MQISAGTIMIQLYVRIRERETETEREIGRKSKAGRKKNRN